MELNKRELFFENLPDELNGKTIFFCGDLHLRQWDYRIIWVQHQMKKAGADLILFSGDMVEESGVPFLEDFLSIFGRVTSNVAGASGGVDGVSRVSPEVNLAPLGMCFVPGNNENGLKDKGAVFSTFEKFGFNVLLNSSLRIGSQSVIVGTDDPSRDCDDLDLAMEGLSEDDFIIALTHSPELFPCSLDKKIPLTLSGHTHGGQVRVPHFGAIWVDTPRTNGKYDAGFFDEEGCQLVVTRGVGMSKLPVRCLCNPEVHLLTLRKKLV